MKLVQKSPKAEDLQCPVCGYLCSGQGGFGCIDKPGLIMEENLPHPKGGMIVITGVSYLVTKDDPYMLVQRVAKQEDINYDIRTIGNIAPKPITSEAITGRTFINRSLGQKVTLGIPNQIADWLGLANEAYTNLEEQLENSRDAHRNTRRQLKKVQQELETLYNLSWWQRFKSIFRGIK